MNDQSNILGDVSVGRKANKLPDTLVGYRGTRVSILRAKTISDYDGRWSKYLSQQPEEDFSRKIVGLIKMVTFGLVEGKYSLSAFSKIKSVFCFGLSTLIDENGKLYPEYSNGVDTEVFYEGAYVHIKDMEYYNGVMLDNTESDNLAGGKFAATIEIESIADADDKSAIFRNKRGFPNEVYKWILNEDGHSSVKLLQQFLKANLLIGLEPVEWLYMRMAVDVKTKAPVLVIDRSTDQHNPPLMRILKLTGSTKIERMDILHFKESFDQILAEDAEATVSKFKQYYENISDEKKEELINERKKLIRLYGPDEKEYTIPSSPLPFEDLVDTYMNPQPGLALIRLEKIQRTLQGLIKQCPHLPKDVPSRLSLLNTRHQVIADAKASKMTKIEMAAFFGLSSTQAAHQQCSKVGEGWRHFSYEPDDESVFRLSPAKIRKTKVDEFGNLKPTLAELYEDW